MTLLRKLFRISIDPIAKINPCDTLQLRVHGFSVPNTLKISFVLIFAPNIFPWYSLNIIIQITVQNIWYSSIYSIWLSHLCCWYFAVDIILSAFFFLLLMLLLSFVQVCIPWLFCRYANLSQYTCKIRKFETHCRDVCVAQQIEKMANSKLNKKKRNSNAITILIFDGSRLSDHWME